MTTKSPQHERIIDRLIVLAGQHDIRPPRLLRELADDTAVSAGMYLYAYGNRTFIVNDYGRASDGSTNGCEIYLQSPGRDIAGAAAMIDEASQVWPPTRFPTDDTGQA